MFSPLQSILVNEVCWYTAIIKTLCVPIIWEKFFWLSVKLEENKRNYVQENTMKTPKIEREEQPRAAL